MKKTAYILMILTIFSQIVAFIRDLILAYYYGTSYVSDVFLISLTIPQTIFSFIGAAIASSFIPLYNKVFGNKGHNEAESFTNTLVSMITIFSIFTILITYIFTEEVVLLFASGFERESLNLAVDFTKITIISVLFSGLIFIYTSLLQLKGSFKAFGLMTIPLNVIMIISIILSHEFSVYIMAVGFVIGTGCQLCFLLFFLKKNKYKFSYSFSFNNPYIINLLKSSLPVLIGISFVQINIIVDRTMASYIAVGGISAITYASKLNAVVQGVFVASLVAVMYVHISKLINENNMKDFYTTINNTINNINVFVIPIMIGSIFFSNEIINVLFARGLLILAQFH
ncbi:hypothetical protein L0M13_13435 [Planococcus sp. 107-1]|nr:lipid II flippase MurJ [Planococcus sp. 107-1]UJF26164.1 hypothetical protein L0M13_13435 [Planococcus sp. 107-1]